MTNIEKLNELFADAAFVESINNLDNLDAIYEAVNAKAPEVTKEELGEYLTAVSGMMDKGEITEGDLDNVAGGGLGTFIAAAYGVVKLVNGCYTAGSNFGKFIGNLRNR